MARFPARRPAIPRLPTGTGSISRLWPRTTDNSKIWAENCPENFENRAALVGAEIARLEGRDLEADAPLRTGHPLGTRQRLCPQ